MIFKMTDSGNLLNASEKKPNVLHASFHWGFSNKLMADDRTVVLGMVAVVMRNTSSHK